MRRWLLAIGLLGLVILPWSGPALAEEPQMAPLQRQIDELKQKLAEVDALRAKIAALEEQLKATETAQKKTEEARSKEAKEHKISGYMQLRYRNDNAPDGKDEFLMRRARLNVGGELSAKTAYRLELQADAKEKGGSPGSKVQLRTAYIEERLAEASRVRFGQTFVPWGYELEASVPSLWTGERALFMDRLFPEQRDIGLDLQWAKGKNSPVVNLALFNGTGINATENNELKDPCARVKFPLDKGSFAFSYYDGRADSGDTAKDGKRVGAGAEFAWGRWAFMGEYLQGQDEGADMRGWYAQLGSKIGNTPGFLFAKFDNYDENTNRAEDEFDRLSLGYFYDLDARTRLTLVYEDRSVGDNFSERSKWDGNAYYLQWQAKF